MYIDFRKLSKISKFDAYPMPRIDDLLKKVSKAHCISNLDFSKGYYQIPLSRRSILSVLPGRSVNISWNSISRSTTSYFCLPVNNSSMWTSFHARMRSYLVGDKVIILLPSDSSKLKALWKGHFTIIRKLNDVDYEIRVGGNKGVTYLTKFSSSLYSSVHVS
jgi:hypothetical protein